MDNLFFFPTLNEEMLDNAGCYCSNYEFSYAIEGSFHSLRAKGKENIRLEDSLESWKVESDGLRIVRQITVEYPQTFKGKDGIACEKAELGFCIIWRNRALKQMGYIMPESTAVKGNTLYINFKYDFEGGEIKGDLLLDTVLYIKKAAENVGEEEQRLINEAGVTVGTIDTVNLNFENVYMEFPIKEIKDPQQPLWWLELKDWEDPRKDKFDEDYVCLYLNSYYDYCPKVGDSIKNIELLIEIISTAYLMIIRKIEEMGALNDTLNNVNLEPESISQIIYYFYTSCVIPLKYESIDSLQKTVRQNIELMLRGSDDQ